jgi:hypothetical protein
VEKYQWTADSQQGRWLAVGESLPSNEYSVHQNTIQKKKYIYIYIKPSMILDVPRLASVTGVAIVSSKNRLRKGVAIASVTGVAIFNDFPHLLTSVNCDSMDF